MKKVLLATTALVLSVGYAAAEVAVSGDGRMGVIIKNGDDGDSEGNFTSRARVKFTLTGETDSGLSFGGSFRVDHQDDSGGKASAGAAGSVYISGSYGKLTMGDIDSASENANGDLYGVGLTGLDDHNEFKYLASDSEENGNPGGLYEYGFGAATVYVSAYDGHATPYVAGVEDDPATPADEKKAASGIEGADAWSIGGKYSTDAFTVGLGYEDSDDMDASRWTISGEGTFVGVGVKAIYANQDSAGSDLDEYGLSGKYTFESVEVAAFWKRIDDGSDTDLNAFGIGGSYDLGGGASVVGGIVDTDADGIDPTADLGVSFKF